MQGLSVHLLYTFQTDLTTATDERLIRYQRLVMSPNRISLPKGIRQIILITNYRRGILCSTVIQTYFYFNISSYQLSKGEGDSAREKQTLVKIE